MSTKDFETRAILILQEESQRVTDAAERVALVVKAMALRRGLRRELGSGAARER